MSRHKLSRLFVTISAVFAAPLATADLLDDFLLSAEGGEVTTEVESFFADFNKALESGEFETEFDDGDLLGDFFDDAPTASLVKEVEPEPEVSVETKVVDEVKEELDVEDELAALMESISGRTVAVQESESKDVAGVKPRAVPFSSAGSQNYYLKNVPTSSSLVFKEGVTLLPRENLIHYKDGSRVYVMPNSVPEAMTFCTVRMSDSGVGRRVRDGREYSIADVISKTEQYNVEGLGKMFKREVVFDIDHEHVRKVYCMTNQKSRDLTLGDLRELSGGAIDVRLREYLDI